MVPHESLNTYKIKNNKELDFPSFCEKTDLTIIVESINQVVFKFDLMKCLE